MSLEWEHAESAEWASFEEVVDISDSLKIVDDGQQNTAPQFYYVPVKIRNFS